MQPQLRFSHINNLTEARFASAAGAHWIGFCFDKCHLQYINPLKAKEIMDWLVGPAYFGIFDGHDAEEMKGICGMIGLKGIQMPLKFVNAERENLGLDLCIEANLQNITSEEKEWLLANDIAICLNGQFEESEVNFIEKLSPRLWWGLDSGDMKTVLKRFNQMGINIEGSNEEKPGLFDLSRVQELLDMLEEG
ncbi:MAG: hypothetical protein EXR21_09235 [Flavobacteriaceae bacterium]|nr:hypothetical protein [Flavobacteriaceae bacterium]